jgi:hypothetical protein
MALRVGLASSEAPLLMEQSAGKTNILAAMAHHQQHDL